MVAPAPTVQTASSADTSVTSEVTTERSLGRGGAQHKSIQERLQREANKLGFVAPVEKQLTPGMMAAADLVLCKGSLAIAVEICVTTTVDHEFGNVKKCLAAGFARVAVVSAKPKTLKDIALAVQSGLGPEEAAKVGYFNPDELIAELSRLAAQLAAQPAASSHPRESSVGGYKVRRHGPSLSEEERRLKETSAFAVIREAMKKKS